MENSAERVSIRNQSKFNIAWVLGGDRSTASSRLQGYLVHEQFLRMGLKSSLIANNFNRCKSAMSLQFLTTAMKIYSGPYTHVIFEGPEWISAQLATLARKKGIIIICVRCDRYKFDYDRYFDLTILPTDSLRDELSIKRSEIIPDMVEVPIEKYKKSYFQRDGGQIKVAWLGHQNYEPFILDFIEKLNLNSVIRSKFLFETISIGTRFTRQWSEEGVVDDVLACDLAIIPIPEGEWFKAKSANRLTMMFSLGMPCVATPIASYRSIGNHDDNVMFATSLDEFAEFLIKFIDPHVRERIGVKARQSLAEEYTPMEIAKKWAIAILNSKKQNVVAIGIKAQCYASLLSIICVLIRYR